MELNLFLNNRLLLGMIMFDQRNKHNLSQFVVPEANTVTGEVLVLRNGNCSISTNSRVKTTVPTLKLRSQGYTTKCLLDSGLITHELLNHPN